MSTYILCTCQVINHSECWLNIDSFIAVELIMCVNLMNFKIYESEAPYGNVSPIYGSGETLSSYPPIL